MNSLEFQDKGNSTIVVSAQAFKGVQYFKIQVAKKPPGAENQLQRSHVEMQLDRQGLKDLRDSLQVVSELVGFDQ